MRPYLEPRPVPSPDQHGIETTPVTQHHIHVPAGSHSQRSLTSQSSPPLQSSPHSQSSAQMTTTTRLSTDLPHPECGDAVAHQSRIVENVINRHASDLTRTIGNDLTYFSEKFIELGFISRDASHKILTKHGIGNGGKGNQLLGLVIRRNASKNILTKKGMGDEEKGSQLLSLVIKHFQRSCNNKNLFDEFVSVFSSKAAYKYLATSMTSDLTILEWLKTSSTVHLTLLPLLPHLMLTICHHM